MNQKHFKGVKRTARGAVKTHDFAAWSRDRVPSLQKGGVTVAAERPVVVTSLDRGHPLKRGVSRVRFIQRWKTLLNPFPPPRLSLDMDIQVTFPGGKRVDAHFDSFVVPTDQPVTAGGAGSAPAPFDLFLASMATCAGIYVLGFCQARGIPTDGIRLVQRTTSDPRTHLPTDVRIEIQVPDGFPAESRDAVARAAAACKVKKTLAAPPSFEVVTVARPAA